MTQEPILTEFIAHNFPKYVQMRCKHNLFRGLKLKILRKSDNENKEITVLAPTEGNTEYTVVANPETQKL